MALIDDLVSSWELDEASGNALDSHGSSPLTETGGTIGTGTGLVYSTARDFESADTECFERADSAALSTGDIDFTIEAWVNAETLSGDHQIVTKDARAGNIEYALKSEPSQSQQFRLYVSSDGGFGGFVGVVATNFGPPSTGTWYQVIAWHDAANNEIGIAVNAGTANTQAHSGGVLDANSPFRIGALGNDTEYWDGLIGPVRFWKRVLSSAERTELYNGGAGRDYAYISGGGGGFQAAWAARANVLIGPGVR